MGSFFAVVLPDTGQDFWSAMYRHATRLSGLCFVVCDGHLSLTGGNKHPGNTTSGADMLSWCSRRQTGLSRLGLRRQEITGNEAYTGPCADGFDTSTLIQLYEHALFTVVPMVVLIPFRYPILGDMVVPTRARAQPGGACIARGVAQCRWYQSPETIVGRLPPTCIPAFRDHSLHGRRQGGLQTRCNCKRLKWKQWSRRCRIWQDRTFLH